MAHLLMVESWVGSMSRLLPRAILESGHRFTLVTRDLHHYLRGSGAVDSHPLLAADNVLRAETNDLPELIAQAQRWQPVLGFDGVITSCDYYLEPVARVAAALGLPGPDPEAMTRAFRKDLSRLALRDAGLPTPGFLICRDWADIVRGAAALGYPLVVKPVDLCAGMYVRRVANDAELREAADALRSFPVNARGQQRSPDVLLEQLLIGPEVSVETITVDGVTQVVGVTDKSLAGAPYFVESGHMFPADLPAEISGEAAAAAVAALAAVGFDRGVAHTELRLTPDGPRVIEINPRPAGNQITELIRRVTGIDLVLAAVALAVDEQPDVVPAATGVGSAAISFLLPPRAGLLASVSGTEQLSTTPAVVDWTVTPPGTQVGEPTSNNTYLGHIVVVDSSHRARARAEQLVAQLSVAYVDEPAELVR